MFTKSRLITVGITLLAIAAVNRVPQAKEALSGDSKFLGIF